MIHIPHDGAATRCDSIGPFTIPLRVGDVMLWISSERPFPRFNAYASYMAARAYDTDMFVMVGGPAWLTGIGPDDQPAPLPNPNHYILECTKYLNRVKETSWR